MDMKLDPESGQGLHSVWETGPESLTPQPELKARLNIAADEPADVWQHIIDGLPEQIALLDENWTILFVNQSWTKVAELYGHFALAPGTDYLGFCRKLAAEGLAVAREVVAGIEEINQGKRSSFQVDYRSSDPEVGHDHQLCINRFEVSGRKFASVTRYDVSRLLELRKLREDFSDSVIKLQEEERRRIGREIHDSTMQLMVALDMKISQFKRTCKTAACGSILDEMRELVAQTQQEIRSIAYLIHPPVLGNMTLPEALQALVEGFGRRTGFKVQFEMVGDPQGCCPAAEGAIYRIVQEALSNVRRHAKARHATVRLSRGKAVTHVIIADDGVGLPGTIKAGVGLSGMRSRLSEIGGRLSIRSHSSGTAVIASIPAQRRIRLGGDSAGAPS